MLAHHLKYRQSKIATASPLHFQEEGIVEKIYNSLGIKITQQGNVMPTIHYDISEENLMYALKTFVGSDESSEEPVSVHVYKNEDGYTKFLSDKGTLVVMPAACGVFSGHVLQVSWQDANSNLQSVYEFETTTSLNLVEWIFTLDDFKCKAWVRKGTLPRYRDEDAVIHSVSISIEGVSGILRTNFDSDNDTTMDTAKDLVLTLCKYNLTQMDFVKARSIANQISKLSTIRSSFELSIMASDTHNFKCVYKNMCLESFSVNVNGTHYFYASEDNYSIQNSANAEMTCLNGFIKCRGKKDLMFTQFQAMDEDIHKLREKYFNLFD